MGEPVQAPSAVGRVLSRERELLELGAGELEEPLPYEVRSRPFPTAVSLVVRNLFEPEAGGAGVEDGEEGQMVRLRRGRRELDDRRRLLEDLAATVEDEVVVRRDKRHPNSKGH